MNPVFVVVTTGGLVYVCASRKEAKAITAGTVYRVSGLPNKTLLVTLSGTGSPYTLTTATGVKTAGNTENGALDASQ